MTEIKKIDAKEFDRVCKCAQLMQVKGLNTWTTERKDEGVELINNKILTFTYRDGERNHDGIITDQRILSVLGAFASNAREHIVPEKPKEVIKNEVDKIKASNKTTEDSKVSLVNAIPDILREKRIITPADITEWKALSTFERILYFQKTPKDLIKTRRGFLLPEFAGRDKKTLTNSNYQMFSYLDANVMKHSANIAFCFQWSAVVEESHYFPEEIAVRGYIQVEIEGKTFRRACGGSCVKKGMMDWGDTMEGAISEMTKRGIYHFLHGDVKRGEYNE